MRDCPNDKIRDTQACQEHQQQWKKHVDLHSRQALAGVHRALQRPGENVEWLNPVQQNSHPHDQPVPENHKAHYFSPSRFYCVETLCAPCGVVIAWAKFAKAESPTNILAFLEAVYPTPESHPSYICIDKACLVLRTSIHNKSWEQIWAPTTRFIVDTYHYGNHAATDEMCRTWCNPAPTDGSAPNLVVVAKDKKGRHYYKRAFNTQVSHKVIKFE